LTKDTPPNPDTARDYRLANWRGCVKRGGVACSFADIAFIYILLKTAHAIKPPATPPPKKRLRALLVFAALTPTLALPFSSDAFLIWQSLVLGAPYLLLAHTVITEFPLLLRHLREKIRP